MAKKEQVEYKALVSDEGGIIRGRIPSPLVRDLGARAGDHLVFRLDSSGRVTVSVSRSKGGSKKSNKGSKGAAKKSGGGAKRVR